MRPFSLRWVVFFAMVVLLLSACSSGADDASDTTLASSDTPVETTTTASTTTTEEPSPVVVLVHGSFHTPETTWTELTPVLDERGIEWAVVDLPSAGPDAVDGVTVPGLDEDVAATSAVIDQIGGPVVLVGHSYGGFVISEAGGDPRVQHLIYLCAFAPQPGETLMQLSASEPPTLLAAALRVEGDVMSVAPELAIGALYADVDEDLAAAAVTQLVPSTLSTLEQPAKEAAWTTVPSSYIICANDHALEPARQREMADRVGAQTSMLETSHSPFLSQPEAVANIIETALQQSSN